VAKVGDERKGEEGVALCHCLRAYGGNNPIGGKPMTKGDQQQTRGVSLQGLGIVVGVDDDRLRVRRMIEIQ
jgi:hypothetical protein